MTTASEELTRLIKEECLAFMNSVSIRIDSEGANLDDVMHFLERAMSHGYHLGKGLNA